MPNCGSAASCPTLRTDGQPTCGTPELLRLVEDRLDPPDAIAAPDRSNQLMTYELHGSGLGRGLLRRQPRLPGGDSPRSLTGKPRTHLERCRPRERLCPVIGRVRSSCRVIAPGNRTGSSGPSAGHTTTGITPQGQVVNNVVVYDRQ